MTSERTFGKSSLTEWEWAGLTSEINLADGHAHQGLNSRERRLLDDLPQIFLQMYSLSQAQVQSEFLESFSKLAGQSSILTSAPPLFHYSSSMSIDVVARLLRQRRMTLGLVCPTFDNIPLLFKRQAVSIIPVGGNNYAEELATCPWKDIDALFVVLPNNPTGATLNEAQFKVILGQCMQYDVLPIIDFSFRYFSNLSKWDQYRIATDFRTPFIFIEDTGKTWSTLDLKVGFVITDEETHKDLSVITDELLLNVSPLAFRLLEEFIKCNAGEHEFDDTPASVVKTNRRILRSGLANTPLRDVTESETISVAWVRLPSNWASLHLAGWLQSNGIAILPGGPFYWDGSDEGSKFVRIALMRSPADFAAAVERLIPLVIGYSSEILT